MSTSAQPGIARLVTFLGRGHFDKEQGRYVYDPTEYEFLENVSAKAPFVCRALAELLRPSEISVLATQEAESDHGAALREVLRAGNYPAPRFVRIPAGRAPAELWQQFEVVKEELRGAPGPVMLDITHGFRSQPFFAAAVATFVHAVDAKPPELRVCYAAYDAKDPKTGVAPIWELTEFVTLLDWSRALAMFLKTGRAEEAGKATEHLGRDLKKTWFQSGKQGEEPNLKELGEALTQFGANLETLRTGDLLLDRGSMNSSTSRLLSATQEAKKHVAKYAPPLADILDRVVAMVEPLVVGGNSLSGEGGRTAVAALAGLYLRLGRYSEAIATVREGWINLYASDAALSPGAANFSRTERCQAETTARQKDKHFRTIVHRRNDLLHAQYQPMSDVQDSKGIIRSVNEIVAKFADALPIQTGNVYGDGRSPCFVNLSNHPSATWEEAQTKAALALAERIEDIAFPAVPPDADEKAIEALAEECVAKVPPETSHVLVQGEFTLTVELVRRLQSRGITCLAATSKRDVEEGSAGRRVATFTFVRFRAYPEPKMA